MLTVLESIKQFHKALVATLVAYRQKADSGESNVQLLVDELKAMTGERDLLVAEQEEALKMIDEMTTELDKK